MVKPAIVLLVAFVLGGVCDVQSQAIHRKTFSREALLESSRLQSGGATRNQPRFLNDVLWWLPEDTEAVSVVRGPFKATVPLLGPPEDISAIEYVDLALRNASVGCLQTIKRGRLYEPLVGRGVLFCVEGSRRFRPPTSLGGMLYEGCQIMVFQRGLGPLGDSLIRQMASSAKNVQSIAGQQVMTFEERLEVDTWEILVAFPAPDVLLCATNQTFLTQVLNRMQRKGAKRALPADLPEWKHVNTEAKFWAVRHYNREDAQDDPSSPLSGEQAATWPDTQAVGIVFELDPTRSNVASLRYLSANKGALKLVTDYQGKAGPEFKPMIQRKGDGPVEMLVSLDESAEAGMLLFVLFWLFGHGVYV
jgi:hypothetical protein